MDSVKPYSKQLLELNEEFKKLQSIQDFIKSQGIDYQRQSITKHTVKLVMDNLKIIQRKHEENIYFIDKMKSFQ